MLVAAAIQFCPTPDDTKGSMQRLAALVVTAAKAGAELIVCPELALTKYGFMSVAEARPYAERVTDFSPTALHATCPSMNIMYAIASRLNVHIVWGLVENDVGTGYLHNYQVLMCPDGTYEGYAKANLWGDDAFWAHEGRANPPILHCNFRDGAKRVGLLICRDVRDRKDEHWDSFYQKGDADVVCLSAAWGDGGVPATTWMDFVRDNHVPLVVSNRYGDEGDKPRRFGGGGVCIIKPESTPERPNGVYCDGLVWNRDCIIMGEI